MGSTVEAEEIGAIVRGIAKGVPSLSLIFVFNLHELSADGTD
jgi:hypothetical protein